MSPPLINGNAYSWASIDLKAAGIPSFGGITSISYGAKVNRAMVYGLGRRALGRTAGKIETDDVELEMLLHEWTALLARLGDGFCDRELTLTCAYTEATLGTVVDVLERCKISGPSVSNSEGTDPTKVKVTLSCLEVVWNGKRMVVR